jgi:hypothetical protein
MVEAETLYSSTDKTDEASKLSINNDRSQVQISTTLFLLLKFRLFTTLMRADHKD